MFTPVSVAAVAQGGYDSASINVSGPELALHVLRSWLRYRVEIWGDAGLVWEDHRARINHVQIAGFPARNEPGGGGFSLPDLCDAIDAHCPGVWISGEYRPAKGTAQGLGWLAALKSRGALIGG